MANHYVLMCTGGTKRLKQKKFKTVATATKAAEKMVTMAKGPKTCVMKHIKKMCMARPGKPCVKKIYSADPDFNRKISRTKDGRVSIRGKF